MKKYLLFKLAEEAGEVVVAAVKYRLHNSPATRRQLEREVGDFLGVLDCLFGIDALNQRKIENQRATRYDREWKRAKRR